MYTDDAVCFACPMDVHLGTRAALPSEREARIHQALDKSVVLRVHSDSGINIQLHVHFEAEM